MKSTYRLIILLILFGSCGNSDISKHKKIMKLEQKLQNQEKVVLEKKELKCKEKELITKEEKIENKSNVSRNYSETINEVSTLYYEGTIGKYPICMELIFQSGYECDRGGADVKGYYYYVKSGSGNKLRIDGNSCGASIHFDEFDRNGNKTGSFGGIINANGIEGAWENGKRNKKLDW
jgi:hypothetical protein